MGFNSAFKGLSTHSLYSVDRFVVFKYGLLSALYKEFAVALECCLQNTSDLFISCTQWFWFSVTALCTETYSISCCIFCIL